MKVQIQSTIHVKTILNKQGLGPNKKAFAFLANRVKQRAKDYTPWQQGELFDTAYFEKPTGCLIYKQNYAHYQHEGKVMGPNVLIGDKWRSLPKEDEEGHKRKYYTGRELTYQGAPQRGDHWVDRMMAVPENRHELEKGLAEFLEKEGRK